MLKRPRHPEAEGGQTLTTAAPARPAPGGWLSGPLVLTPGSGARETPGAVSPELDALRKEVLYEGGHVQQALARVDEALTIAPSYVPARWDRAQMLFAGKKDFSPTGRAIEDFLTLVPTGDDALRARAMLEEARRQVAGGRLPSGPPRQVDRMSGSRR